jgi:ATP-binding cassette, subfamily B, bacterial MsbA
MMKTDSKTEQTQTLGIRSLGPYVHLLSEVKLRSALLMLLMLVSTAIGLGIPLLAGRFIDALSTADPGDLNLQLLALLGAALVLQLIFSYLYNVHMARLGLHVITRLRHKLVSHLIDLPCLYFTNIRAGDLSTRMTSDIGSIQYVMTSGIIAIVRSTLTIVGALVLMFSLNVQLTVVVICIVPITALITQRFGFRLQKLTRSMYDELGQIGANVQEIAGSIRTVKVYNNQQHELNRLQVMFRKFQDAGNARAHLTAILESLVQILLWICLVTVVVYGFQLSSRGLTTQGTLVSFFLLTYRLAMPVSSLTGIYSSVQGALAATGRLDAIMSQEPEHAMGDVPVRNQPKPVSITLEDVNFKYDDRTALENLNLEIEPGMSLGVVGPSGAGKTTLAGLIMRLFDPQSGQLLLDGTPYREFDLKTLRGRIAYVSQEPVIHDTSLEENIRFGLKDVTRADVETAARQANILDFINDSAEGMQTNCGERGVKLSGGERQRIALARAFLRDPDILILDEPTSSLDAKSEQSVRAAIQSLMKGRTSIIIAHRFSLVRDLDRIVVIDDGKIIEAGRHDELISANGFYQQLYAMQNRESH